MKSSFFCFSLIILFFSSCKKDITTKYEAFILNQTANHAIKLSFFKSGIPFNITLNPNDSLKIADGFDFGTITVPGFSSNYFGGPNDSINVIFDNQYLVSHYFNSPANLSSKYLLFSSLRNLGNPNSYIFNRYNNLNSHYYIFTEQDYLDAR